MLNLPYPKRLKINGTINPKEVKPGDVQILMLPSLQRLLEPLNTMKEL
jgi:hypothetical protein